MIRTYITVPFSEQFGDFVMDWKELKTLCITMTYQKKNGEASGSLGIRYFISSKELSSERFEELCRRHWGGMH
ncbi:MAG: hypothetical protein CENE_01002 [Candidatus Celerinatantimonas neptuna]|nr:MAG: hypothetical protein CENE_01002 [Candidatus Celerinatantimonas neptuna]